MTLSLNQGSHVKIRNHLGHLPLEDSGEAVQCSVSCLESIGTAQFVRDDEDSGHGTLWVSLCAFERSKVTNCFITKTLTQLNYETVPSKKGV